MESSISAAALIASSVIGTALAVTVSWSVNHSIFWAVVHGAFSWLYLLYYAVFG